MTVDFRTLDFYVSGAIGFGVEALFGPDSHESNLLGSVLYSVALCAIRTLDPYKMQNPMERMPYDLAGYMTGQTAAKLIKESVMYL